MDIHRGVAGERIGGLPPQRLLSPSHKVREIVANGADGLDCQTKNDQLRATEFDSLDTEGRT